MHLDRGAPSGQRDSPVRYPQVACQLKPLLTSETCSEYEAAHIDLPVAAAKIFATLNDPFNFVYVSRKFCADHRAYQAEHH